MKYLRKADVGEEEGEVGLTHGGVEEVGGVDGRCWC